MVGWAFIRNFAVMNHPDRQPWLDYVRCFSIFLVILFHTPPRLPILDDAVILNLRVPVFFCISGFLFSTERATQSVRYLLRRCRLILVPYTVFFLFFYALWLVVGRTLVGAEEQAIPIVRPLAEFVMGNPHVVVGPFWYLACLLSMLLIYYGLSRIVPTAWMLPVCLLLAVAACFLPKVQVWNVSNALMFLPFYALGNSFRPLLAQMRFSGTASTVQLCLLAAISIAVMVAMKTLGVNDPATYNVVRIGAGLMVIPAYLCAGRWLAERYGRRRWIEVMVMGGTIYLALQNYAIGIIKIGMNHAFYAGVMDDHAWLKPVVAIVVAAAIYPAAWWLLKHAPWVLGKGCDEALK